MKKISYFLPIIIILFSYGSAFSCDVCGSGASGINFGTLPLFHKNYAGFRYRHTALSMTSPHASGGNQQFQTGELSLRFYPLKRLQVLAFIPFSVNSLYENGKRERISGLGDAMTFVNYQIFNTDADTTWKKAGKHSVWAGGGIKVPTGSFAKTTENGALILPGMQPGSGSTDFLAFFQYTFRYKKWGINSSFTGKFNTANRNQYRFGSGYAGSLSAFYLKKVGNAGLLLNAGIYMEKNKMDKSLSTKVYGTGGTQAGIQTGLELYYRNIIIGGSYNVPVEQSLADDQLRITNRFQLQTGFLF